MSTAPPSASSLATSSPAATKRSSRLHAASKRSSRAILSSDVRRQALSARVAALEADNAVEEEEALSDEWKDGEEADEQVLAGAAGAKAKGGKGGKAKTGAGGKRKGRGGAAVGGAGEGGEAAAADGAGRSSRRKAPRVSLLDLVESLGMRAPDAAAPNYLTATSAPPTHPPRSFCAVCGYLSCYTCVRCGMRYCSIACQRTHNDTTCIKFGA